MSRSTQDHHLNKLWWTGVIDATYQVSWKSVHRFQRGRFFKGFYHIWAWQPACHVTSIMSINFLFLEPESLHIKFGSDWASGFWEKPVLSFICNWRWVKVKKWPWPSILTCLHDFMQFQVTGCKCSENSTVFTFSYRKALVTKFDLVVKYVKVNPGSSFEQTIIGRSHQCYIPSFVEIGPPVREKKIFEGFLPYMGMAASLSCDQHHVNKFNFLVPESLHIKFGFDWPSGFWEKKVLSFVCKWPWTL